MSKKIAAMIQHMIPWLDSFVLCLMKRTVCVTHDYKKSVIIFYVSFALRLHQKQNEITLSPPPPPNKKVLLRETARGVPPAA